MRIIKPATVKDWMRRHAEAQGALNRWMILIKDAEWSSFSELRSVFSSADEVPVASGRKVVVFNIKGNHFRLIAAIHYNTQTIYVMNFLTHAEYDKDDWKAVL